MEKSMRYGKKAVLLLLPLILITIPVLAQHDCTNCPDKSAGCCVVLTEKLSVQMQ